MSRSTFLVFWLACVSSLHGAEAISFNRQIRPILSENCFACHGFDPKHREAGLRLDTFADATAVRDGVQAIVPGKAAASELWTRIVSTDPDVVMPPPTAHKAPLTEAQRALIKGWIDQGAPYETHWAFIPPKPPEIQATGSAAIDYFIGQELKKVGLTMSGQAGPEKLIRRVSLDLIGLPPTPEEIDAFTAAVAEDPEAAYADLVDRLLESPHYGERWGRWWLDQARYADSNGYSIDAPRSIWKYRDWVVNAFNADLPFDEFTIEQLAGDLLPNATEDQKVATGFHRNTAINQEGGIDEEQFRIDSIFDRVATTGTVWLGLTIGCAQCHDHKFDPIEQKEYYRLFAFLNNQEEPTLKVSDPSFDVARLQAELERLESSLAAYLEQQKPSQLLWESELKEPSLTKNHKGLKAILAKPYEKRTVTENAAVFAAGPGAADQMYRALYEPHKAAAAELKTGVTTMVLKERAEPRKTTVYIKGDFTRPADEVSPGTPAVLHAYQSETGRNNRLDLARWIVSPDNPLTARVIMNRVWQQYFGRGIVETENDFGSQGSLPSHPELLDWLAREFIARDWSLKEMHRLIVTSQTYRQSSTVRPELKEKDPHNYLLGRQQRLRLDAEIVRDSALTACGLLSEKMGGPPVYPPIPEGVMGLGQVKRAWKASEGPDRYRRGLYTFVYRATPPPSLTVFDAPDGQSTCTRRIRSNTPLQALTLLNDIACFEFATALQQVIEKQGLEQAFRRCTSRHPTTDELKLLGSLDTLSAARVLLNLDETVTRD
ncbi:PSD1 and planctomycete cytochrome C domain-containing protein [Planctomicrobium piriforme]|nr:PSD1 and planctomycete cytochrome C domain-containing protein [Planctomicrobium piriforme]